MAGYLFDADVAARYDRFGETEIGAYVDRVERSLLEPLLGLAPGMAVVDLGCGTGSYTLAMAEAGCRAVGVDISPAMLAVARRKRPRAGSVAWVEADLARLPFPEAAFDRALLNVTLEFVADPRQALAEARRVLAPGGRLVVGLLLASGPWAAHYRARARGERRSVWRRARFYDPATLASWLGRPADEERRGLWVSPESWAGTEAALAAERRPHRPTDAGFVALAWEVGTDAALAGATGAAASAKIGAG